MAKPQKITHKDGGYEYRSNGELHREDGPAVASGKGDEWWFTHNQLHRIDGPAVTHANGSKWWYQKGQLHREDGPAYEGADGSTAWYMHGKPVNPPTHAPARRKPSGPRP